MTQKLSVKSCDFSHAGRTVSGSLRDPRQELSGPLPWGRKTETPLPGSVLIQCGEATDKEASLGETNSTECPKKKRGQKKHNHYTPSK